MMDKLIFGIYGLLLLVGGCFGFKAGSKVSLIMGLISGVVVLFGVYLLGANIKAGYLTIVAASGVLTLVFLIRFLKTQSFMPSGMLLLLSVAACLLSVSRYIQD